MARTTPLVCCLLWLLNCILLSEAEEAEVTNVVRDKIFPDGQLMMEFEYDEDAMTAHKDQRFKFYIYEPETASPTPGTWLEIPGIMKNVYLRAQFARGTPDQIHADSFMDKKLEKRLPERIVDVPARTKNHIHVVFRKDKFRIYVNKKYIFDFPSSKPITSELLLAWSGPVLMRRTDYQRINHVIEFPINRTPHFGDAIWICGNVYVEADVTIKATAKIRNDQNAEVDARFYEVSSTMKGGEPSKVKITEYSGTAKEYDYDFTKKKVHCYRLTFRCKGIELYMDRTYIAVIAYPFSMAYLRSITIDGTFLLDEVIEKRTPHFAFLDKGLGYGATMVIRGWSPEKTGFEFQLRTEDNDNEGVPLSSTPVKISTNFTANAYRIRTESDVTHPRKVERETQWTRAKFIPTDFEPNAMYSIRLLRYYQFYEVLLDESSAATQWFTGTHQHASFVVNELEPDLFWISDNFVVEDVTLERLNIYDIMQNGFRNVITTACVCEKYSICKRLPLHTAPGLAVEELPNQQVCRCIVGSFSYECKPYNQWVTGNCVRVKSTPFDQKHESWRLTYLDPDIGGKNLHMHAIKSAAYVRGGTFYVNLNERPCICYELWKPIDELASSLRNYKCVPYDGYNYESWNNMRYDSITDDPTFVGLD